MPGRIPIIIIFIVIHKTCMVMIDSSVVYTCTCTVPTTNNMSMKNNVPGPLLGLK